MEDHSEQSKRNGILNLYYYIVLVALGVAVVWHWIFGGQWGYVGTVLIWSFFAITAAGLLNAIGLFGRR